MYAVMETGGKQYRVQVGDVIFVEKLDCEADSKVTLDKIVMVSGDDVSRLALLMWTALRLKRLC